MDYLAGDQERQVYSKTMGAPCQFKGTLAAGLTARDKPVSRLYFAAFVFPISASRSPTMCSRMKFVAPDRVRVPATIPST